MPLAPCGQVMDYLRSCYSTNAWAFDPGTGFAHPWPLTWVWAPTGASVIGVHHQYGSQIWTKGVDYEEQVGEILGVRRSYWNGRTNYASQGYGHCGGGPWIGRLTLLSTPMASKPDGQPACCPDPPSFPCPVCPGGVSSGTVTVTMSGGTGFGAPGNGVWHLPWTSACTWGQSAPVPAVELAITAPQQTCVQNLGFYTGNYQRIGSWDCASPITLFQTGLPPPPGSTWPVCVVTIP